jgi:hypothetical protein
VFRLKEVVLEWLGRIFASFGLAEIPQLLKYCPLPKGTSQFYGASAHREALGGMIPESSEVEFGWMW